MSNARCPCGKSTSTHRQRDGWGKPIPQPTRCENCRASPPLGAKVYVAAYKRPFTVRARDERYAVCTRPFPPKKTVLYFVLDAKQGVRGTENLVFGVGAETDEQCAEMLARLAAGETEVSHRNVVHWDVIRCIEGAP